MGSVIRTRRQRRGVLERWAGDVNRWRGEGEDRGGRGIPSWQVSMTVTTAKVDVAGGYHKAMHMQEQAYSKVEAYLDISDAKCEPLTTV